MENKKTSSKLSSNSTSDLPKLDNLIGGAMRDRTADLLDANQALSQLSYSPVLSLAISKFYLNNTYEQTFTD